jgi:hypothetical protein
VCSPGRPADEDAAPISSSPFSSPASPAPERPLAPPHLVVVARDQPALCQYLSRQFAGDPRVRVLADRRRGWLSSLSEWRGAERRRPARESGPDERIGWVFVTRADLYTTRATLSERSRGPMEGMEDRQRIDRWVEESQYLIGRMIPGLLDDRERMRGKLDAAEHECRKLREELAELRKEVSELRGEAQFFRNEHAAIAEALSGVLEHLGQVQKPLHDVYRRLQVAQPAGLAVTPA